MRSHKFALDNYDAIQSNSCNNEKWDVILVIHMNAHVGYGIELVIWSTVRVLTQSSINSLSGGMLTFWYFLQKNTDLGMWFGFRMYLVRLKIWLFGDLGIKMNYSRHHSVWSYPLYRTTSSTKQQWIEYSVIHITYKNNSTL